jgi:hypothetical protein
LEGKGVQRYEKFKGLFDSKYETVNSLVDLAPKEMLETHVFDVWKGWLYCIEFRKP